MSEQEKAVVLVSGGLDSTTVLAMALAREYDCHTLSFDYGQRHRSELVAAECVSQAMGVADHKVVHLDLDSIGGSALTDPDIAVPEEETEGIPVTYVPARNTVFLAIALGWAEVLDARKIFIGVNAVDYSGGSLAQLVEQLTFNQLVAGSNPARPTKQIKRPPQWGGLFCLSVGSSGANHRSIDCDHRSNQDARSA